MTDPSGRTRTMLVPLGLGAAGLVAGAVLAGTTFASAAAPTPTPSAGREAGAQHSAETAVTDSSVTDKVKAAVLAKYPGGTVTKVESDSSGYEAELTTASGAAVHVDVSHAFVVGSERGGGRGFGGHSNTDPAHEAGESAGRQAEEKAADAGAGSSTG